jgi:hypothetical protein
VEAVVARRWGTGVLAVVALAVACGHGEETDRTRVFICSNFECPPAADGGTLDEAACQKACEDADAGVWKTYDVH